jgi:hypothetical protein
LAVIISVGVGDFVVGIDVTVISVIETVVSLPNASAASFAFRD